MSCSPAKKRGQGARRRSAAKERGTRRERELLKHTDGRRETLPCEAGTDAVAPAFAPAA
jgi:hypothetical protein